MNQHDQNRSLRLLSATVQFIRRRKLLLVLGLCFLLAAVFLVANEIRTSRWQAAYLADHAVGLGYQIVAGRSDAVRFPEYGPFDQRMGYTKLPQYIERLTAGGFKVSYASRFSDNLLDYVQRGYFPPYHEKTRSGLDIVDCRGEQLYRFRYPYRGYDDFAAVPPRVADALMFVENRDLLDESRPTMNPAIDWVRFSKAVIGQVAHVLGDDSNSPGGSTLATQIEKYRHSPDGVTANAHEKLRQMMSASVRAYLDGELTLPARRRILLDYLNTVPLSAVPGYGEVNGLADGMWVWFASDFNTTNDLLAAPEASGETLAAQGLALRQVVALMIAHRRPSYYLAPGGRARLEQLSASYVRLLAESQLIGPALRDAALAGSLKFRDMKTNPVPLPPNSGKGSTAVRNRLAGMLGASLYELDRFDASVSTTLHGTLQREISDFLEKLSEPDFATRQGVVGEHLLTPGNLKAVRYSFNLVERTPDGNRVRVQTDTTDQPLDINEGSKLELGSTAKLRVLTTYLEMIAELHQQLAERPVAELRSMQHEKHDRLTAWALEHLIAATDRSLPAMLQAALERRYSASPGENFFTGGGEHHFNNYRHEDDGRNPTVREALQGSINLVFVRLMRDVVRYAMLQIPGGTAQLLKDDDNARRKIYLTKFADQEGQVFLRRFWHKYAGKTPEEIREIFLDGLKPNADRLAAVFRYLSPQATPEDLAAFLEEHLEHEKLDAGRVARLYTRYAPDAFDLPDRGYIARVHPLELWLAAFLSAHPDAGWSATVAASADERQAVYRWLFTTRFKGAQDSRIHTMQEVEAFLDIHRRWARLGYPFGHLVPSLASALGSSGDRPAALAELMGIIVNDGVRLPTLRLDHLEFATGTPYETRFVRQIGEGERVMAPEVAAALRSALSEVVEGGTARRLSGAFKLADGTLLPVGGKTGTGDNRIVIGHNGSRGVALNRTATFVFYLGPRHFGTLTAYVIGPEAGSYGFTSALPVQILKSMGPLLLPLLDQPAQNGCPP
ncbi:MAG: transglycosylase domain-containing protein [Bacteroidota bacterium]